MMEDIHRLITEAAATTAGFNASDISYLVQNITLPDFIDFGLDRGYRHVFIPVSNFGYAPSGACSNYRKAVNNNDLLFLAKASHYMQDLSCVFHTVWNNQKFHKFYEWQVENMVENIKKDLVVNPVYIDNVYVSAVELASISESYAEELINALWVGDNDTIYDISRICVNNAVDYTLGMYQKFFKDIAAEKKYDLGIESSINPPLAAGLGLMLLIGFI